MDIQRPPRKNPKIQLNKKIVMLAAVAIASVIGWYAWNLGKESYSVDRKSLVIAEVKRGNFLVSVRGSGVLTPNELTLLSSEVDANVKRVLLKAGNIVKRGDLIVELENPQLMQELTEATWEVDAIKSESKAAKVSDESALAEQHSATLNTKLAYEHAAHEYEAYSELAKVGVVSQFLFKRSKVEMDQAYQRWNAAEIKLKASKENLIAQNKAREARLNITLKRRDRIQWQVDSLQVVSPIEGILLNMPLEVGERISSGNNIAKLALQDSLIAELRVPEIQISDVQVGQRVVVDTRNNKFEGRVQRVDPTVVNGNVQVDVAFTDALPPEARPDLSVDGEIMISDLKDALFVDRPLFVQSKSQSKFYLVTDNSIAKKVVVTVGQGSTNSLQILGGLKEKDRIIVSDPTRFETYDSFRIQ